MQQIMITWAVAVNAALSIFFFLAIIVNPAALSFPGSIL